MPSFAAAVALFGMKLRGSQYAGTFGYAAARELAAGALGEDPNGHRRGMLALVDRAAALSGEATGGPALRWRMPSMRRSFPT